MPSSDTLDPDTQDAIRKAVAAALRDNRDWLRDLIQDALLDAADAEARREADLRDAVATAQQTYATHHGRA